ncbi:MAG: hypothetical protein J6U64_01115 [Alphaproteobacteria bacterium]|nr:hypothetical protein [Alphaproteobacteria bacterium]
MYDKGNGTYDCCSGQNKVIKDIIYGTPSNGENRHCCLTSEYAYWNGSTVDCCAQKPYEIKEGVYGCCNTIATVPKKLEYGPSDMVGNTYCCRDTATSYWDFTGKEVKCCGGDVYEIDKDQNKYGCCSGSTPYKREWYTMVETLVPAGNTNVIDVLSCEYKDEYENLCCRCPSDQIWSGSECVKCGSGSPINCTQCGAIGHVEGEFHKGTQCYVFGAGVHLSQTKTTIMVGGVIPITYQHAELCPIGKELMIDPIFPEGPGPCCERGLKYCEETSDLIGGWYQCAEDPCR